MTEDEMAGQCHRSNQHGSGRQEGSQRVGHDITAKQQQATLAPDRKTGPEAEGPILWPSHEKRRVPGKDPDVGKG